MSSSISDCPNCDGRKCMGCVCRDPDHDCADDCPACGSSEHDGWTDHADCPEDWTVLSKFEARRHIQLICEERNNADLETEMDDEDTFTWQEMRIALTAFALWAGVEDGY